VEILKVLNNRRLKLAVGTHSLQWEVSSVRRKVKPHNSHSQLMLVAALMTLEMCRSATKSCER
jgi:hypothetical protein